jgi:hypothetical protein
MRNKKLKYILISILVLFSAIPLVLSQVTDTATINVNVSAYAEITVSPTTLNWTNLNPGSSGTTQLLDITNTGSLNVSNIYAYVDTLTDETSRPYGNPDPAAYAAGGVIVFKNETYNKFFFAGRLEWNWTEDISNLDTSGVTSPVAWGFFKNASNEYVWLVGSGSNGFCNESDTEFAIEDDIDQGTTETRTPTTTSITLDYNDTEYSYFSINRATAPLYESCVAVYKDCTKIYIYRYDKRTSPGFSNCANSAYIQSSNLVPYDTHTLTLNAYIPRGIPSGDLATATFTVVASP